MSSQHLVKDTLAVLRGLQIVLRAVASSNDECVRKMWANSSIRTLLQQNIELAKQPKPANQSRQVEQLLAGLRETLERGGVAIEGARQFAASAAAAPAVSTTNANPSATGSPSPPQHDFAADVKPVVPPTPSTSIAGVDISAITLKEFQSLLSQKHNKISVTDAHIASDREMSENPSAKPSQPSASVTKDEQYVEQWIEYIGNANAGAANPKTPPDDRMTSSGDPQPVPKLSSMAKQRRVPSSRIGRLASFGSLFAGLGLGTASELTRGALGLGGSKNMRDAVFSPANTDRIVDTLCRVRGAALKIGQLLSIQDETVVSPELVKAFERVRQAADYMPDWQVERVMRQDFGPDWRTEQLRAFDERPFAAASIGQVHRAELRSDGMVVAVKIQYPGVARGIESDIDNLVGMLKVWDVFPPGFFIDNVVRVAKRELRWEVDYVREADYTEQFAAMIAPYPEYRVPKVVRSLSTANVLTSEFVPGVPLDRCFELPYAERYFIASALMKLCLRELFELRCMQTDPNWSNFLYDGRARQLVLIDFGATRFYTEEFIDNYRRVIQAALRQDGDEILRLSRSMGFLTGYESQQMLDAHTQAVLTLGEPFRYEGEYDFSQQNMTKRISSLVPTMVAHRLCPPPEEIYSIHRKLSGIFLLCARLKVRLDCRQFFQDIVERK